MTHNMKQFLIIPVVILSSVVAKAQSVQDANKNTIAYITTNGELQDKDKKTVCTFRQDGKIVDTRANTVGYIVNEYELQDKARKTIAYILRDGTVEDSNHKVIAHISTSGSGPITDNANKTIAYIDTIEPMWAAAYLFVLKN